MKRVLEFDGSDKDISRFGLLYQAMVMAQVSVRGMDVLRAEARIFTALEAVSVPSEPSLRTITGACRVILEQPDFDIVKSYLEKAPWTTTGARAVADLDDFLSASEKV